MTDRHGDRPPAGRHAAPPRTAPDPTSAQPEDGEPGTTATGTTGQGATQPANAQALARSSALMAAGTLASRILGVIRLAMLGGFVGLAVSGDAFDVANALPNQLYLLLAGGVLNAILVPQITKAASHADGGERYVNRLLTLSLIMVAVSTVIVTACAPLLVRLYSDFDTASLALATSFAFLCLPQVFFYGVYSLIGQVLNARGRFIAFMWAPAVANVVAIAGLVYLGSAYPHELAPDQWTPSMILILGGTATLGVAVQAFVLLIPLHRSGFRYRPVFGFRGAGLRGASTVALWTVAAVGLSQFGFIFTSKVLTGASEALAEISGTALQGGGKAGYTAAFLVFMLPHSLVTVSFVTALFPQMSRAAHDGRRRDLVADLGTGLRLPAVVLVPVTVGSVMLAGPVLELLFAGKSEATISLMSGIVVAMMLGVIPYGWLYLIQRAFYAHEDARTPFVLQVVVTVLAIGSAAVAVAVAPERAALVVGLGQTAGNLLAALIGFVLLRRRIGPLDLGPTVRMYIRMTLATVLAALVTGPGLSAIGLGLHESMPPVVRLAVGGGSLVALALALAHLLRVREVSELLAPLLRRLPGPRA